MAATKPFPNSDDVAEIQELVRGAGLRCTAARMDVIQRLRQANSPLTHAVVAADLVPLGFDKATVFRNLTDLAEVGLVTRSELGDHVWRFELRGEHDSENGTHPHFVCVDCGSVTCLSEVELPVSAKKRWAKIGRISEILLKGHCKACQ